MKYIIEIKPEYEDSFKGVMILGAKDSDLFVDTLAVENLEELTSDYINEHFGDLQDEAYQRGLEEGKKAFDLLDAERDSEYQRGLNDAWEAARKIALDPHEGGLIARDMSKIFGCESVHYCFKNYSAAEALDKLKAYEEKNKADDEIKVGDEVNLLGDRFIVTRIFQPHNMKRQCDGIDDDGCVYNGVLMDDLEKTGRHFDIDKILEEMRHD